MRMLLACLLAVAAFGAVGSAAAQAHQFYVDPAGNDDASGLSPASAWRTVARVNRAHLRPGDIVAFRAGRSFFGAALTPGDSGANGYPIVYTSYGNGKASLREGVVIDSISWVTIKRFRIRGPAEGVGSRGGPGSSHIDILDNDISYVERGLNSPNPDDSDWLIADNAIEHTGDSGIIAQGRSFTIVRNTIHDTGKDPEITYGKHGIYSKSANSLIEDNWITNFSSEGVSTRFHNTKIIDNVIRGGEVGIGYYRDDPEAGGVTTICGNTISGVDEGLYIGPTGRAGETNEHFHLLRNTIVSVTGRAVDAPSDRSKVKSVGNRIASAPKRIVPSRPAPPCGDAR
jgi:hypothetical protein